MPARRGDPGAGGHVTRFLLGLLYFSVIATALAFLTLPIVAIFTHVGIVTLVHQLSSSVVSF